MTTSSIHVGQGTDKATVYIETTSAGHLTSQLPKDPIVAGQMLTARRWWKRCRPTHDCFTSQAVLVEAGRGDPMAAAEHLHALAVLPVVRPAGLAEVELLADLLLARAAVPSKARADALHVAAAVATAMTYLLTWNWIVVQFELNDRGTDFQPVFSNRNHGLETRVTSN